MPQFATGGPRGAASDLTSGKHAFSRQSVAIMTKGKVIVAFLLALLLLVAALFAQQWSALNYARRQVQHTEDVIENSRILLTHMLEAETNQRGYIISRDQRYLGPYRSSLEHVMDDFSQIVALVSDNPAQVERIGKAQEVWRARADELRANIEMATADRVDEARARIARGRGQELMEGIRWHISAFIGAEQKLLTERLGSASSAKSTTRWLMIAALTAAAVGLLYSLFSLQRDNRHLAVSVEREREAAVSLERARAQLSGCVHAELNSSFPTLRGCSPRRSPAHRLSFGDRIEILSIAGSADM